MTPKITKSDLNRVFWRMQLLNVTNNFQSMQAIGFLSSFVPVLERLYKDRPKEERVSAMKRHLKFFNSHVNSDALILGITAAIEENTDETQKDTVTGIKTGLMGPLAGIGDSVLKFTWLPICGSIGATLALNGSILGPIIMFLLYNSVNIASKYYGIHLGYSKGVELINGVGGDILQHLSTIANIVGLMVIGGLIASVVKVNVVSEISAGDNVIVLQDMFDKVMPGFLSILTTFLVYKLLKKTNGKHAPLIIAGIMAISVVLTYLKVLG
ncbi:MULTISPECIES: PTS system mannose/fructose/sorbose family transporter subunit IID [Aerococcus]|uniref:PTS system mannose/fructose/sorbose family transporter subunit IID n=1 Tax=Aerococcus loyolae TaxID=2976809 RepID=A0ABT4C012_9LACT|nr:MULTISPECIES: PTS system mannose/fructose/sorbose family transporter subunit IID [Aerococcus]KAA9220717.1 PTS system mannose/fructose/sorbose family transporter subunit IID [Aerococcus loyolae]KAA9265438.1 PTS system mannose/fructose/sorbose family transporter subunit IID [Aerococcus loyolae]MCY3025023.1 PTS system mannose/fructose/sorbose family transporter subunit IID [Aerococcus loyolae]MCY3026920.1 PTS system mannose/fructose/sorbose family transporter subunit IID [Aerococcus loyolae]MC